MTEPCVITESRKTTKRKWRYETPCVEGGIIVWDSFNDHLTDHGNILADELIKFVFRNGETKKSLSVFVENDECITPGREVKLKINQAFDEATYGYESDDRKHTVGVDGDDGAYDSTRTYDSDCDHIALDDGDLDLYRLPTNDNPSFADDSTSRSVPENTAAGQPVGDTVTATDDGNSLTYSLDGGDGASFDVDSNGQLRTKAALDYEGQSSYTVTLSVSDNLDRYDESDTREDASIDVTIEVTDVNEPPQFDDDAPTTLSVDENTATDTIITEGLFTATDPDNTATDPTKDTLTYSLGGTDEASFDIDDETGQIKTKAPLDYESDPIKGSYSVTIQVTDGKDDADAAEDPPVVDASHMVTITVTNVDEDGTIAFSSDPPVVNAALTASVEDPDGGVTGEIWVWEISGDGQSGWTVITGEATSGYTPGSDDVDDYLRVTATYTDSFDANKTATDATGQVQDRPHTNENPSFSNATTTRSVAENTAAGENIGDSVSATHADSKGTLVYSLGGTDAASFDIEATTGQLKTKAALDFETTPSYTVTVSVSDGLDDYSNTDTTEDDSIDVTITVTNIDVPTVPGAPIGDGYCRRRSPTDRHLDGSHAYGNGAG